MEHPILRIPMPDSVFDELEESYMDNDKETSHDFVWGLIRKLCKDARLGRLNKTCTVNVLKDGKPIQDQIRLRGFELPQAETNSDWLPPKLEKDEVKYFEHKVTEKTMEYLRLFCSFAMLRHTKYADSLEEDGIAKLAKMKQDGTSDKEIESAKVDMDKNMEKFRDATPRYMEEIIFNSLYPQIHQQVATNVDKELDKENEEVYPKKAAKTA